MASSQRKMEIYVVWHHFPGWRKKTAYSTVTLQFKYLQISLTNILCFQYIHGLAARGVHYLHRPGPILQDVGFMFLPVSPLFLC